MGHQDCKDYIEDGRIYFGPPEYEYYIELRFPTIRVAPNLTQEVTRESVEAMIDYYLGSARERWIERLYGQQAENQADGCGHSPEPKQLELQGL